MTDRSSRPAFLALPDRSKRVGPPPCQWRAVSQLSVSPCSRPSTLKGATLLLCDEHLKDVANLGGYYTLEKAEIVVRNRRRRRVELLKAEIKRLERRIERLTTAKPAKAEPAEDGVIYFARSGGYVKIGWTSDLGKRMKAYPPDTQLLAVMPGTRKDERATHKRFAHLLTHGREWFPLAPQITEYVDQIVREHGQPPVVDFAAKRATRIVGPRLDNYVGGVRGNLPPRFVRG